MVLAMVALIGASSVHGQTGVSVNTTGAAPDASSILDISSTDKGVLFPRVADHTSLTPTNNSDDGLFVYDTTTDSYWYWDASVNSWKEVPNADDLAAIVVSLDEAYDGGRTINADAGNVEIQGAGHLTVAANIGIGTTTPDRRMKISGTGWTALEVENTDNQDAAIELTSQGVSNYVYTDNTGFLGLESASGQSIALRTDGANERMVVQSDGRVRVNNLAEANGAVITSNAAGVLGKTPLSNDANDVLLGTGVFGPASAFEDDDWYQVGSTNTPTAITDYIHTEGHVGIGNNFGPSELSPSAPLQVTATGAGNPATNAILVSNPTNSAGQDAIVTARVGGSSAGDPFFSLDISGEAGWSIGIDNDHDNRLKIAPSWSNISAGTALTIKTDGNTGVGVVDPTERLSVTGTNTDTYPALGLRSGNDNNGFNNGAQIAFGYNGSATYQHFIQTRHNSSAAQNAIDFYVSNGTQNNTLTSGSTHVMSLASGNVGVGTTAPASVLHVSTTQVANVVKVHNPTLANGSLVGHEFGKNNNTNNMAEFRYNHISDGNAGNWINLGLWGSANTLNVVGTGNVGIGTTGPAQKLEVAGNTRITGLSGGGDRVVYANNNGDLYASTGIPANDTDYIWNQNGSDQAANFRVSGSGSANVFLVNHGFGNVLEVGDDAWIGDINGANFIGVYGNQNSTHGGIRLGNNGSAYVYSNGTANVGVGTTSPAAKLHVAAGEGGGIIIGNPNDNMGNNGGSNSIMFYGYRDVISNAIGAKISAERTNVCCGWLSQGTELAFYTNSGLTTSNADNSVERVRITDNGRMDVKAGMRTERQIRFYKRSRGNGQGGVDNLGNYDFCYLAGVAFRNSDSYQDEDDDYQCNVYTQDINGSAEYNEGENEDFTTNFSYSTRPYWRMYSECYQDCSNSTCTAMCINFDF